MCHIYFVKVRKGQEDNSKGYRTYLARPKSRVLSVALYDPLQHDQVQP